MANFAHYRCAQAVNDTAVLALCHQVGLKNLHQSVVTAGLTKIEVSPGSKARYIPYTNSELNWHTDGYYYPETYPVRAMLLHCVRPALEGGATELINHEIVYALLAQRNPDYVAALSRADVMTIPAIVKHPTDRDRPSPDPCSGKILAVFTCDTRLDVTTFNGARTLCRARL